MKKLFLFLFLFCFLSTSVLSVKPITEINTGDKGFDIRFPQIEYTKVGEELKLHFHIFNRSDGLPIDNSSTECYFHLYAPSGGHQYIQEKITYINHIFDFEVELLGTNFTNIGTYDYIFQCNNTAGRIGGFIASEIIVTIDGEEEFKNDSTASISVLLFFMSITVFLLWFGFRGDYNIIKGDYAPLVNFIISRGCWLLAATTMAFNTGVIASIIQASGINLLQDVFAYQWILLRIIYVIFIWLVVGSVFEALSIARSIGNKRKYAE